MRILKSIVSMVGVVFLIVCLIGFVVISGIGVAGTLGAVYKAVTGAEAEAQTLALVVIMLIIGAASLATTVIYGDE